MKGFHIPITVVSPKWVIVGNRKIDLNGIDGDSFDGQTHRRSSWLRIRTSRGKDGTEARISGEKGKPGSAGGSGGTFFGIGDQFLNGEHLTITANGGIGGAGENGGNGWNGTDGTNPRIPPNYSKSYPRYGYPCVDDLCGRNEKIYGFDCEKVRCYTEAPHVIKVFDECFYKIFGKPGKAGGDGGDGGRGGKGGYPGTITLFELSYQSGISKQSNYGRDGKNGAGGLGGISGVNGDDVFIHCRHHYSLPFLKDLWGVRQWINTTRTPAGRSGITGANVYGIEEPKDEHVIIDSEMASIINEYKTNVREHLVNRFIRFPLMKFLNKLNGNNNVKKTYDTLRLLNELQATEEQFHKLQKMIDLVPVYQSFLSRISEYAEKPMQGENSTEHKKVLNYLYTATLSRINNMKSSSESSFTTDIREYLSLVTNDIHTLKDLKKVNNKAKIMQKYNDNYKSKTDDKIKEAKNVIEKEITPEIDNIGKEVDSKIDLLIHETIALKEQAQIEEKELIKIQQELENNIGLRGFFNFFKISGAVITFLGPVGLVFGTVVGAASTVAESLVLDPSMNEVDLTELPPSVISNLKILGDQINTAKNQKIENFDKLLREIINETETFEELLSDTAAKANDIKNKLDKIKGDKFDLEKFQGLEKNLREELKRKENELTKNPDEKSIKSIKLLGKLQQAVELCTIGFDVYTKYKEDQSKLDALTDAIKKARHKFQMLEQYEKNIYNYIIPMLNDMGNNLTEIAIRLGSKSHVFLDVTKWKVQRLLRDMKSKMQTLTQGFQAEDKLVHCIGKLEDAMNVLITIYDRIQNYQEQQELVNFLTDISSPTASNIDITDLKLINAINYLESTIRSNLVLKQYEIAINSFKQWVFPFAHSYLEEPMLPHHLQLENNLSNLVSKAMEQIESLKGKLDLYKLSIQKEDECIHAAEFGSRYNYTQAFYTWKSTEHKEMIANLLSGKEVIVKADAINSPNDKDAIKFNVVDLYFKSHSEILQSELDDIIKGFKMSVTHLGNSYYRYGSRIYLVMSDSVTIRSSFQKNAIGEPVDKNAVYIKLKAGNFMLSPYAVWKIKLTNSTSKTSFSSLEMYKDKIDVELIGNGSYVAKDACAFNPMVEKEYTAINAYNMQDIRTE